MNTRISQEELALFEALRNDKLDDSRTFSKSSNRGIWKTIIEQYPESAHFIYELLQNANDAKASYVEIILSSTGIIFKHNGTVQFSVTALDQRPVGHINSITSIGDSSKDGLNTIGKFGIGFKSVFTYTDAPEIYDDKFWFRIDDYIVPTLLDEDHCERKDGETLFWLPFKAKSRKKSYEEIAKKVRSLDNPILFLDSIQSVVWKDVTCNQSSRYTKTIEETCQFKNVQCELLSILNSDEVSKIWMFHKNVKIKGSFKPHRISVGYYLKKEDDKYIIDTSVDPKVFCFFPTSERFHQKRVMHAPFILTASRSEILEDDERNDELIEKLAELSADSLVYLRDIGIQHSELLINENLLDLVSLSAYYTGPWDWEYVRVIQNNNLLVTKNGSYCSLDDARIAQPNKLLEIISDKQLTSLLKSRTSLHFVFQGVTQKDFQKTSFITKRLHIQTFDAGNFASAISADFMKQQSDAWLHKFYSFVKFDARELWNASGSKALFRFAPIIRTSKGEFVAPYIGSAHNVFLASTNIDADQHIVDSSLLKNKTTKSFFNELGIGEMKPIDQIASIGVKHMTSDNIADKEVLEDTLYVCNLYLRSSKADQQEIIERLAGKLRVAAIEQGEKHFALISTVYDDTSMLNEYFKGNKESGIKKLNSKFYARFFDEYGQDRVTNIFHRLGLLTAPRIESKKVSLYSLSEQIQAAIRKNYSTQGYWISEMQMHGLEYALSHHLNKETSIKIWEWLGNATDEGKSWDVLEYQYFYYTKYYCKIESSILRLLKTTRWIYVDAKPRNFPNKFTRQQLRNAGYCDNEKLFGLLGVRATWEDSTNIPDEVKKDALLGIEVKKYGLSDIEIKEALEKYAIKKELTKSLQQKLNAEDNDFYAKKPMRKADVDEMFSNEGTTSNHTKSQTVLPNDNLNSNVSLEERMERFLESQDKEREQEQHLEELRDIVECSPKYSIEWFKALLELEYRSSKEDVDASVSSRAISISFQRVEKEKGSERIFILKNPAKPIPVGIEEIGGLTVNFQFSNKEEVEFSFEVASVRDFTLRLKAKIADIDLLDKIDWTRCTHAEININNPVELIGKLRGAFEQLNLPDGFNLKDNIRDDVEFVFGPPGTGKTTYLSKYIVELMATKKHCRVLVLAPTNKACDVLTTKIMSLASCDSWLGRFVACGDQTITNMGLLCDRDSALYKKDQCCLVSTIARLPYDGFDKPRMGLKDIEWDYVIIDEASMIPIAQIVYALYKFANSRIIVAGDPFQISPIVREEAWVDENIYTMVHLNSFTSPETEPHKFKIVNLDTQYRSLPTVGTLFSEYAYNGMLKHHRQGQSPCGLLLKGLDVASINFIPFRVERYDSIYGPRKLGGSNVQIYSVLLTVEFAKYISKQWRDQHGTEEFLRIGVICPYAAQAQLIDTLLQQRREVYPNVEIVCGTIHGFQGDECDVVITVLNTPKGLKGAPDKVFINRKNILNVAISRARDYLFVLIPHIDTDGYGNLEQILKIGSIAKSRCKSDLTVHNADEVEKVIFNDASFIERNTFVTSHQMTNVYTDAQKLYEVRIDENAVDIQINSEYEHQI